MDALKEILMYDPCYEQHIVAIRNFYEDSLISILVTGLYEGFLTLYKNAYSLEQKYTISSQKNPDIENPGILVLFQMLLKDIPNLNTHKIRTETDRIKSSTKSADIFDDLVRAVCKSNIILLTYNVDHKRRTLLQTKYHENIIIHDFIHSCYVQCSKIFYTAPELYYHLEKPHILNQNKREAKSLIEKGIRVAIKTMLPMKEILLEYVTQKYEQKEKVPIFNPYAHYNPARPIRSNNQDVIDDDEFFDVDTLVDRDLKKDRKKLLDDATDNDSIDNNDNNEDVGNNDMAMLLESESDSKSNDASHSESIDSHTDISIKESASSHNNGANINKDPNINKDKIIDSRDVSNKKDNLSIIPKPTEDPKPKNNPGVKMIDLRSFPKKGPIATYFNDMIPEIKKRHADTIVKTSKADDKEDGGINQPILPIVLSPNKIASDKNIENIETAIKLSPLFEKNENNNDDGIEIVRSTQNTAQLKDNVLSIEAIQKNNNTDNAETDTERIEEIVDNLLGV